MYRGSFGDVAVVAVAGVVAAANPEEQSRRRHPVEVARQRPVRELGDLRVVGADRIGSRLRRAGVRRSCSSCCCTPRACADCCEICAGRVREDVLRLLLLLHGRCVRAGIAAARRVDRRESCRSTPAGRRRRTTARLRHDRAAEREAWLDPRVVVLGIGDVLGFARVGQLLAAASASTRRSSPDALM